MFDLRGVRKSFAGRAALAPLDLSIAANRTTVLLGPSGCGKSTLLRLLLGLLTPDGGTITFAEQPVTPATAIELRRRMGYVVQDGGLFPHLTAAGKQVRGRQRCGRRIAVGGDLLKRLRGQHAREILHAPCRSARRRNGRAQACSQ
jgi:osmoprotectant transport system ATP-binding protein